MVKNFNYYFNKLSANRKGLIIHTMVYMEHSTPLKDIDIKYGIYHGIVLADISKSDLLKKAQIQYMKKKGLTMNTTSPTRLRQ